MQLTVTPTTLREANAYVEEHHRHHDPVAGSIACLAVADDARVVGVAIVGRPLARMLQDGWTAEVLRTCVDSGYVEEVATAYLAGALFKARERGAVGVAYAEAGLAALRRCPWLQAVTRMLSALWRACQALGYRRLVTYTLAEEGGASLRAAGWRNVGAAGGGTWSRKDRPRVDTHPTQVKMRWEAPAPGEDVNANP
jgi:hypothetical protein